MSNIQKILTESIQLLTQSDSPRLDSEILLCHVLGVTRSYLYAWSDKQLSIEQYSQFKILLNRRIKNEPIAYITGYKEFWSLNLQVTKATLIPRPETELLVEQVLTRLTTNSQKQIIDLGTGSGAIALAIAKERPYCHILATDSSKAALKIAKKNAKSLKLTQVNFIHSHWWKNLNTIKVDIVVSNPPYIAINDSHLNQANIQYEPKSALIAGKYGLNAIQEIIAESYFHLKSKAWLLLEHGYDQEKSVCKLFLQHKYKAIKTYYDLNNIPRVTVGQI
ncbi:MAG: peptide chain release factor N(5)-glutamine methyltransferase [Thiomargarita sp.]|nr:peptide chain release factor N(5)-glutamine methyltransferase [Thiomargarita sp.]